MKPGNRSLARALEVYTVYANRPDPLAEMRAKLPPGLAVVGFLGTDDDIDISLWRPFGQRRVEHVLAGDSREEMRKRQIQYVVVSDFCLRSLGTTLEDWRKRTGAEVLATITVTQKVAEGPQRWHLARLGE